MLKKRFLLSLFAFVPATSLGQPTALPTLNVRLRHICLSIADNDSGAINVSQLSQLPKDAPQPALQIQESWSPAGTRARTQIVDGRGGKIDLEEVLQSTDDCHGSTVNNFYFELKQNTYKSMLCISPLDQKATAVGIAITVSGTSVLIASDLERRVLAIASCYQPRRLNAEYDGFKIEREIVKTKL